MEKTYLLKNKRTVRKERRKKSEFIIEVVKNKALLIMMIPGVLILLLNNYLPMFGIVIAFKNLNYAKGFFKSDWVGFKNFEFFIKTPDAFRITRNTLLYNAVFIILGLIVSVSIAIALNEIKNRRMAKFYQSSLLFPYFLSWVTISYIVFSLLSIDTGFINNGILQKLGLERVYWYNEAKYWPVILTLVNTWKWSGYNAVIYIAAITGIDESLYEAAKIDGATTWQQVTNITIPLISPQIIILTLLSIGRIFYADFGLFFQIPMNSGLLYRTTNVMDTYVYNALLNTGDIGMAAAAGLYQALIGFVLILIANKIVRSIDKEKALF